MGPGWQGRKEATVPYSVIGGGSLRLLCQKASVSLWQNGADYTVRNQFGDVCKALQVLVLCVWVGSLAQPQLGS